VRIVVAYGSSLISAVYISGFHIAAIGVEVDSVWTCETIAHTSNTLPELVNVMCTVQHKYMDLMPGPN
jgi:hypothetical protein